MTCNSVRNIIIEDQSYFTFLYFSSCYLLMVFLNFLCILILGVFSENKKFPINHAQFIVDHSVPLNFNCPNYAAMSFLTNIQGNNKILYKDHKNILMIDLVLLFLQIILDICPHSQYTTMNKFKKNQIMIYLFNKQIKKKNVILVLKCINSKTCCISLKYQSIFSCRLQDLKI